MYVFSFMYLKIFLLIFFFYKTWSLSKENGRILRSKSVQIWIAQMEKRICQRFSVLKPENLAAKVQYRAKQITELEENFYLSRGGVFRIV